MVRPIALSTLDHAGLAESAGYTRNCERCGVDLYPPPPARLGAFMLADGLWAIASRDGEIACLCLVCTEETLGCRLPSWVFRLKDMVRVELLAFELRDRLNPATDPDRLTLRLDDPERLAVARREYPVALGYEDMEES